VNRCYSIIVFGNGQGIDNVLNQRLRRCLAKQLGQSPIVGISIELIDQRTKRLYEKRGLLRNQWWRAGHGAKKHQKQCHE